MICECKSKAFYLHLIYIHDIPLKLTIAKAIAFGKQRFHGLVESYKKVSTLPKTWFLLSIKTLKVRTISVPLMKRLFFIATVVLYIYIAIAFFVYYSIACQKHGSIAFFISIFYFCSLLRPLFFYDSGCRLSIIWLFTVQRYGGSVRYQTPGDALFG